MEVIKEENAPWQVIFWNNNERISPLSSSSLSPSFTKLTFSNYFRLHIIICKRSARYKSNKRAQRAISSCSSLLHSFAEFVLFVALLQLLLPHNRDSPDSFPLCPGHKVISVLSCVLNMLMWCPVWWLPRAILLLLLFRGCCSEEERERDWVG